jgi:hypothetical protein
VCALLGIAKADRISEALIMTPTTLTELRIAEDAATAAQARLAILHNIQRDALGAMLAAGNIVLRSMDQESFGQLDLDALGRFVAHGIDAAMNSALIQAEDHANDAANFLDDLECEGFNAGHAEAAE